MVAAYPRAALRVPVRLHEATGASGPKPKPIYKDVGDPVASGIALANGVAFFKTVASGKLVALDAGSGKLLKEIELGPVWSGPSVSRADHTLGLRDLLPERIQRRPVFVRPARHGRDQPVRQGERVTPAESLRRREANLKHESRILMTHRFVGPIAASPGSKTINFKGIG